jgi:hypothetical protein
VWVRHSPARQHIRPSVLYPLASMPQVKNRSRIARWISAGIGQIHHLPLPTPRTTASLPCDALSLHVHAADHSLAGCGRDCECCVPPRAIVSCGGDRECRAPPRAIASSTMSSMRHRKVGCERHREPGRKHRDDSIPPGARQ